ncbi:hypothetical protein EGT74_04405 [Chitinophaga lutea]|uniref:Uncharacterized protein n=2 Tax=Chitinophaga lutea TaxID=2488634 RepID=A0A3N4PVX9_9BACT|nr:hypothetical protein EGT74_04405 [Chitinophaga lutea]
MFQTMPGETKYLIPNETRSGWASAVIQITHSMKKIIPILICTILLGACRQISRTVEDTFHPRDTIIPRSPQSPQEEAVSYSDHHSITTTSTSISITTDIPLLSAKDSILLAKALQMYQEKNAQANGTDSASTISISINGHQIRLTPGAGATGEQIRFEKDSGKVVLEQE